MDRYQILETTGIWAGAIATFLAVIVSLWLSRRDRPRLKVSVDERIIVDPAAVADPGNVQLADFPLVMILTATNTGPTRIRINGVGWYWYFIRGLGAHQNPPEPHNRSRPEWPTVLEHADTLQWVLDRDHLVKSLATGLFAGNWWWRLKLELFCVAVNTTFVTKRIGAWWVRHSVGYRWVGGPMVIAANQSRMN
jgi:hypothetical protein